MNRTQEVWAYNKWKTKMKTRVIFRKWPDGDIIALFPDIPDSNHYCLSYMHVGQHGGADYSAVLAMTTPAKEYEYMELAEELTSIGYDLEIRKRRS